MYNENVLKYELISTEVLKIIIIRILKQYLLVDGTGIEKAQQTIKDTRRTPY